MVLILSDFERKFNCNVDKLSVFNSLLARHLAGGAITASQAVAGAFQQTPSFRNSISNIFRRRVHLKILYYTLKY